MSDLMIRECDILNVDFKFEDKITVATEVATALNKVLEDQGLVMRIKGGKNKYVIAEGWNTLGTMLGTYARTEEVVPFEHSKAKIAYKARVSIMKGEQILSTAEAIATSGGFQKDEPAIYSMAQTRAMGKAYRMAFSWIVKMAGYEPTPAEEMPTETKKEPNKTKKTNEVIEAEIVDVTPEVVEDNGDEINYEESINTLINELKKDAKPIRKVSLINLVNKSEMTNKNKIITYIKENLDNKELGAKYDKS